MGERSPRPLAFAAVAVMLLWVGSGQFFRMTGEGRTIGFGEDALWFPHQAAKFAGKPGMPSRFLSFHNGHAALFEYYHGPERKVYIDPRLEVAGADLFLRFTALGKRIENNESPVGKPSWPKCSVRSSCWIISTIPRSVQRCSEATTGRCVWFDSIAAVFVHDSFSSEVRSDAVDFADRHFRPDPPEALSAIEAELDRHKQGGLPSTCFSSAWPQARKLVHLPGSGWTRREALLQARRT